MAGFPAILPPPHLGRTRSSRSRSALGLVFKEGKDGSHATPPRTTGGSAIGLSATDAWARAAAGEISESQLVELIGLSTDGFPLVAARRTLTRPRGTPGTRTRALPAPYRRGSICTTSSMVEPHRGHFTTSGSWG